MSVKLKNLGQYFTTNKILQQKIYEFVKNDPEKILEPSVGKGNLVEYILSMKPETEFDAYEIDKDIEYYDKTANVNYENFLTSLIDMKYKCIIGNPPYVRTKKGNLYVDFVEKCFGLLDNFGEIVFIVPSDFFKLTCASSLLNKMMLSGTFTHIFYPKNEKMFENANIDVMIFRYQKDKKGTDIMFNDKQMFVNNTNGILTFSDTLEKKCKLLENDYNVYVGLVSGKEDVYETDELGNFSVLTSKDTVKKYIMVEKFPSNDDDINGYLENHKNLLMSRKIRKFTEKNWFEWGALRNYEHMKKYFGKDCIYIKNLTRSKTPAFLGKVQFFGGSLIMILPKNDSCDLIKMVEHLNSEKFRENFTYSGRFKIGQRQLCNTPLFNKKISLGTSI